MPDLYPFQFTGSAFLAARKAALLADEPGLGKTIQAIDACNNLKARKILVLCPAIVKLNWKREMEIWLKQKLKIQVVNSRKDEIPESSDVVICNYDLIISPSIFKALLRLHFAVGIFDESHYLKNRTAQRTKAVLLKGAIASRCVYRWCLTGTPVLNRPIELYPMLKALAPGVLGVYNTFDKYARRFCGAYWDGFQLVATGATHQDELCTRLNGGFMLRRMKKDHLKDLPDKQYQMIQIPADGAEVKDLVKKEFTFSRGDARYVGVNEGGAELAAMRHVLALSKVDVAADHIMGVLDETPKVVIFAHHRDVIAKLRDKLASYNPVVVTGDTHSNGRQSHVDRFQKDPTCRVFIGQTQAAGVGITLTAAAHVIFVETDWVPGIVDQAIDRCHRIGQKDSVMVQFLVIQDSLEEYIVRTMIDKKADIERIVDQSPSVAELFT